VGEICIPIVEALVTYDQTSEIHGHLKAIHCMADERDGLIKIRKDLEKKEKKFMSKASFSLRSLYSTKPCTCAAVSYVYKKLTRR